MGYETEQEQFWAGDFGDNYISRNNSESLACSKIAKFSRILSRAQGVSSAVELGCNIGLNLKALKFLVPEIHLCGYEINAKAVEVAQKMGFAEVKQQSIVTRLEVEKKYDLSFTNGVLIHINPEYLHIAYENLFNLSSRYIMVSEYFNPSPVTVTYRGNSEKLFKRDFAGELIDLYNLKLVDYGFVYNRDNYFPQDNCNWFLLEKS